MFKIVFGLVRVIISKTDNPPSSCPSELKDKVRRIVSSKLEPFHFEIETYCLSDANYARFKRRTLHVPNLIPI